jgi:hypothetical protein
MTTPRGSTSGILPSFLTPPGLPTYLHQPLLKPEQSTPVQTHEHKAAIPDQMPILDLNAHPQPLDQRYVLLADEQDEALSDVSVIELTPEEQEHLAHHILRNLTDNLKPLSGAEYLIVIPAVLFALGACATSKDFGDKFVEGLESLLTSFKASPEATKTGVAWGIAAANVCAQFSLSTNSVITVLTRLLRSRQRTADAKFVAALADANETASKYDKPLTKKEMAYIATVPLSAAATYKMGFDTLTGKYGQASAVGHSVGALRYGSASLINFNFMHDQIYRWRGDNDNLPIINLLKTSKKRLNNLADDARNPLAFIQALNLNNLLKQLNGRNTNPVENNTSKRQIEALVDELFQSTAFVEAMGAAEGEAPRCTKSDVIEWISIILGGLVSLTNFKAGTRVPELFGLTVAKDLVHFFSNLAADWTLGIAALGFVFGVPSWFTNLIINTRSCMNFANGISSIIKDISTNGTDALKKYWSADGALVAVLFITSIGYGAGNGGSGFKYPPLDIVPVPIINLLLSTVVFTALGNLSQQGAVAKLRDKMDDTLLQRAINTENLEDFHQSLTPSEQNTLRRLLVNNINLAFDSQIASYNKLQDGAVNGMFSEELRNNLESRYSTDLTSLVIHTPSPVLDPSAAPNLVGIRVDPMTTIEQKSVLASIRVDSRALPTTPPLHPRPPVASQIDTTHARTPGGYTSSPPITSSSPMLFHSGSPSNPINIRRKHHHPVTHHHTSIMGTETGLDGFSTNLMAPTRSPSTISPGGPPQHSPHTPRLYSTTPSHPIDSTVTRTTIVRTPPKYGSSV